LLFQPQIVLLISGFSLRISPHSILRQYDRTSRIAKYVQIDL